MYFRLNYSVYLDKSSIENVTGDLIPERQRKPTKKTISSI